MEILDTKKYRIKLNNPYEIFVPIDGADNQYISSCGRLIRLIYDQPVIIPHRCDKSGEEFVEVLWNDKNGVTVELAAMLVANAFLINESGYTYVWYKDRKKDHLDCRNLFFVADHEAQKVVSDSEFAKKIAKRQRIKSTYNLNDYKLRQLFNDIKRRCKDPEYLDKHEAYKEAYICEEWEQDRNKFYEWARKNFYEYPKALDIDKDILSIRTGKRCYSPDNCCFVPEKVNMLFRQIMSEGEPGITKKTRKDGTTSYSVAMTAMNSTRCYDNLEDARLANKRNKLGQLHKVLMEFCYASKFGGYDVPQYIIDAIKEWYRAIESDEIVLVSSGLIQK